MSDPDAPYSINALMARIAPAARADFDAVYRPTSRLPTQMKRRAPRKPARRLTLEERDAQRTFYRRRQEMVYALRRGGVEWREIANLIRVSTERARQIFNKEERRLRLTGLTERHIARLREIVRQLEGLA